MRARYLSLLPLVLLVSAAGPAAASPQELAARADALLTEQGEMLLEGRKEEVLAAVDETLVLYEKLEDPYGQAAVRVMRGMARWGAGGGKATVADLEAALVLLRDAGDPLGSWLVLWALAEAESQEGRLARAEARLREALVLLAELEASSAPLDFRGLEKLGRVCGSRVEMLQDMGPLAMFVKPLLLRLLEVPVRETLSGVLVELDRLDEAERELELAFRSAALFGGLMDFGLHLQLGDLRRRQWRLDEARESYLEALEAPRLEALVSSAPRGVSTGKVLDRLAELESLAGRFAEALRWNDRALSEARKDSDRSREAAVLENRGELFLRHGEVKEAEESLCQAERIAREIDDGYRLAVILGDLGTCAMLRGSYEEAATYFEHSVGLLQELDEPYVAAPTLLLLVESYQLLEAHGRTGAMLDRAKALASASEFPEAASLAQMLATWNGFVHGEATEDEMRRSLEGFLESAAPLLDSAGPWPTTLQLAMESLGGGDAEEAESVARELLATPTAPLAAAFARLTLGVALMRRGDLAAAEAELERVAGAFQELGQRDLEGMAWAALAGLRWRGSRRDQATRDLEKAVTSFERVVGDVQVEELLSSFLGGGRGLVYGLFVDMLAAAERPRDAFVQAERSRARALLRLLGNQRLRPLAGSDPEMVARADALRAQILQWERALYGPQGGAKQRLEGDLQHARRDYEDLLVRLKVQSPEYASLASVDPLTPEAIQETLDPGVTLISYFLTETGSYAWVIDRERFEMSVLPLDDEDLWQARCWVRELGRTRAETGGEATADERGVHVLGGCEPSEGTAERLYEKLFAPLAARIHGSKLVIVPHGPLHFVPFAALRDPRRGRFLIEEFELTLAPSASVLPFLRDKETPLDGGALVLGAPAIEDPHLSALAGAREEAGQVGAVFGVEPLLGAAASEEAVRELAGSVDLLHVAAHGVFHPGAPRFSRVALAAGGGHDGNLEVHEVFAELDLSGTNLVVLSACNTAVGPDTGGDEIVSLTRAFLYAGSPGVLSTLWAVQDEASAELMAAFYARLGAGEPAAAALRGAQIEMLRRGGDPFFWAGYTLTGDPRATWGGDAP